MKSPATLPSNDDNNDNDDDLGITNVLTELARVASKYEVVITVSIVPSPHLTDEVGSDASDPLA